MNATLPRFAGLTSRTVAEIVGPEAASLPLRMMNEKELEHARDWTMPYGVILFGAAGLARIVERLVAEGHPAAASRLSTAVANAIAAAPEPELPAFTGARVSWATEWERDHT